MTLNVQLLDRIASWLENGAVHELPDGSVLTFNMQNWMGPTDCGTAACIAGAAIAFADPEAVADIAHNPWPMKELQVPDRARGLLGLNRDEAYALFQPEADVEGLDVDEVTPELAAITIRNLITTGLVEWPEP